MGTPDLNLKELLTVNGQSFVPFPITIADGTDYLTHVVAFGSAFFGALAAYWFARWQKHHEEKDAHCSAGIEAQFALVSQLNRILCVHRDYLDEFRSDPQRETCPRVHLSGSSHISIAFEKLTFIALSNTPEVLQTILAAENNYLTVQRMLLERNTILQRIQRDRAPQDFDSATGRARITVSVHEHFAVKQMTDFLYESADEAVPRLERAISDLGIFMRREFKTKALKIIDAPTK